MVCRPLLRFIVLVAALIQFGGAHAQPTQLQRSNLFMEVQVEPSRISEFERKLVELLESRGYAHTRHEGRLPNPPHRKPINLFFRNSARTDINVHNIRAPDHFIVSLFASVEDRQWRPIAQQIVDLVQAQEYCRVMKIDWPADRDRT